MMQTETMQTHLTMPKGIIWDMDGTALNTEVKAMGAWMKASEELRVPIAPELVCEFIGRNARDVEVRLTDALGDQALAIAIRDRMRFLYKEELASGIPIKDGVLELLQFANGIPVLMAVATSTGHELALHKLEHAGIGHFFTEVIGGDQVTRGKPDPEIFLRAAEAIGVHPSDCWALEDSNAGVESAAAAGLVTFLVRDLAVPTQRSLSLASRVFDTMHGVLGVLRALVGARS